MRAMAWVAAVPTALLPLVSGPAEAQQRKTYLKAMEPHRRSELPAGRTDKLTAAQWRKADAIALREAVAKRPDVRPLTGAEMRSLSGRGPYRNKYFAGTMPWHRSLRDVNLCNGNLFKSFTDIQVAPAKGAGLAMQRTYNSQDDRIGPFGQGWTHAYDLRTQEENPDTGYSDDSLNYMDRTDFFGGRHKYHRDADGLYSPPPYLFDETDPSYNTFLVNGPVKVLDDTEHGMDGTVKHFVTNQSSLERVCDYIDDRYGNRTNLAYTQTTVGGQTVNLLQSVTDPSGRQILYTWANLGGGGQPAWRITLAQGPAYSVAYAYNADLNLASVTLDPGDSSHLNRTTTFGYTSVTGINGTETGLLASVTDGLNHTVSYGYTAEGNYTGTAWPTSVTEPSSGGNQTWTIAPVSTYGADPFAANVSSSGGLGFNLVTDTQLRQAWTVLSGSYAFQKTYDSANNVTFINNPPAAWLPGGYIGTTNVTTQYMTYGPHGNVLTQSGFSDPAKPKVTTSYFNASQYFQKASVTDQNGHTSSFIVGDNQGVDPTGGQATSSGNKGSVLYVRDAGYGVSTSPSYQKQFVYQYNSYGQKVQETNLNATVTQYTYGDQWGNLTQVVQDPHVTQGDGHLARTTAMLYDGSGRVLQSSDPMGRTSTFSYNVLGQPLSAAFPATGSTPAETISYVYGANGRTQTVTDNRGTTTLAYEPGNDRVSSVTDPVTGVVGYTYALSGERLTMSLPGGGTWTYGYGPSPGNSGTLPLLPKDDPNAESKMLTSITDDQGRRVDYWLDESGRPYLVRSNQAFDSNQNLLTYQQTAYSYDNSTSNNPSAWLTTLANTWNYKGQYGQWLQSTLVQNDYVYDNSGQRQSNAITSGGSTRTELYGYDEVDRLKTVDYGDGQTQSYAFDAMSNRTSKVDSVNGTEGTTVNAANMLLTRAGNAYTNDLAGNTLSGGGRTNTWDSQNRLVQCVNGANTSSFVYGADGLRRQSTVNGVTTDFVLDNSMFVRERRAGSNVATYFVGPRGPIYRRDDSTGAVRWYLYDGLGSVLGEVDPTGAITSSRKYDVYGAVRGGTNPSGTSKHKFVGQLGHPSEDETGLIYMQSRYCDPTVGRFLSQDTAKNGGNWFLYCDNDPINRVDANGQDWLEDLLSPGLGWLLSTATGLTDLDSKWTHELYGLVKQGLGPVGLMGKIKWLFKGASWLLWLAEIIGSEGRAIVPPFTPVAGTGIAAAGANIAMFVFAYTVLLDVYLVGIDIAFEEGR
jgi:RHS repeat-associated protein